MGVSFILVYRIADRARIHSMFHTLEAVLVRDFLVAVIDDCPDDALELLKRETKARNAAATHVAKCFDGFAVLIESHSLGGATRHLSLSQTHNCRLAVRVLSDVLGINNASI